MRQRADVTASLNIEPTALHPPPTAVSSRTRRGSWWRWELPFWLGLFFWSLYPSLTTPWLEIGTIPISSKDLVTIGLATFYALCALASAAHATRGGQLEPVVSGVPAQSRLPILTVGIAAYAALSTMWSHMEARDSVAMLYTLLATVSAMALGYLMVANRPPETVHAFMWRLTLFLAVLGLLYSAESFFSLGLRSEMGNELDSGDFGIQRVRGPLFASSTGFFILLPAAAFAVQQLVRRQANRILSTVVALALLTTVIALGSRAGLVLLGLFIVALAFVRDTRRSGGVLVVISTVLLAIALVFSVADVSRLQDLHDEGRFETHRTSWQIIANRPLTTTLLGSGYGSYWPWYLPDVELGADELFELGLYTGLVSNPFGMLLYHSHSTLLLLVLEVGALGLIYFVALWLALVRLMRRSIAGGAAAIFGLGVTVSGLSMFFDLFLFRMPQMSTLWWIFFFGALTLIDQAADGAATSSAESELFSS
jgi:O-antigen ligase